MDICTEKMRVLKGVVPVAAAIAALACSGCEASPAATDDSAASRLSVSVCSQIISKAEFSYTEYDIARALWNGESRQKPVNDYLFATADGRVIKLPHLEDYIGLKVGDSYCEGDFQWSASDVTPQPDSGTECDKVTAAKIYNESSIAGSNLFFDGAVEKGLKVFPTLETQRHGAVIVGEEKYVLHPVGAQVCFTPAELAAMQPKR